MWPMNRLFRLPFRAEMLSSPPCTVLPAPAWPTKPPPCGYQLVTQRVSRPGSSSAFSFRSSCIDSAEELDILFLLRMTVNESPVRPSAYVLYVHQRTPQSVVGQILRVFGF